jgi:hypothetical protein
MLLTHNSCYMSRDGETPASVDAACIRMTIRPYKHHRIGSYIRITVHSNVHSHNHGCVCVCKCNTNLHLCECTCESTLIRLFVAATLTRMYVRIHDSTKMNTNVRCWHVRTNLRMYECMHASTFMRANVQDHHVRMFLPICP